MAARVEGQTKAYMLDRIKILGYLSLHTRQLDMIMSNNAKVNYYRNKINTDIRSIIKPDNTALEAEQHAAPEM